LHNLLQQLGEIGYGLVDVHKLLACQELVDQGLAGQGFVRGGLRAPF